MAKADQTSSRATSRRRRQDSALVKDSIQAYLRLVRRYPVLSREQEQEVARRFVNEDDEEAASLLVNSNLRLVVKIAHEYRAPHVTLLDLIQEGNLGLIRAVHRFDPDRGVRLSSYAQWWIRAFILKYLMDNHRLVKVGTTQAQRKLYYNLHKAREHLRTSGVEPTTEAIADYLELKERDVAEMQQRLGRRDMRLNAPVDDENGTERGDLLPADIPLPEEVVADREFWGMFRSRLDRFQEGLQGRDVMIWNERLLSDQPLTLRELAGRFGVSRERVRQLEARIVRKLRAYITEEMKAPAPV